MKKQIKQLALLLCTLVSLSNIGFAAADTTSDSDTLLNWAENNYPTYFPTHQTTQSTAPWLFRFYPETNVYAGVNTNDNGVYVFGGPWGNVNPTYIDSLSNLLLAANNGKLTDVISFATGVATFVIKANGTLWGWGLNSSGAVGDGTNEDRLTPVKVVGLADVTSVVSGRYATIALKNDGTVWAWGSNWQGDLGNGVGGAEGLSQNTPLQLNGLTDVMAIGYNDSAISPGFYAIKKDGTLWTWGCQANKILDRAVTCPTPYLPTQIKGVSDVIDFRIADFGIGSYFVLKNDGTVWAWGGNTFGQLGDDTYRDTILGGIDRNTPLQVAGLTGVKDIAVVTPWSSVMVYALKEDGTIWAWGENAGGKLGTELKTITVDVPTQVIGLTGITKIAVEASQSLALKNDGTVWAWGSSNLNGAIGVGSGTAGDRTSPVLPPIQLINLTNIVDIKTGIYLSYALKEDGTVWGWGSGLLQDGTPVEHFTPTPMCSLTGFTDIILPRLNFSPYLLRNDGTVWNGYFDVCTQL